MLNHWHAQERALTLHQLGTDPARGLEPGESTRRLREHGPNRIAAPAPAAAPGPRLPWIADPAVLLPGAAAAACGYLGAWADGAAIGAVAAANAWLVRARGPRGPRAGADLGRLAAASGRVVRGGRTFIVPAAELVPGDLAVLAAGERVPADLRLVAAQALFADESALTGEAVPAAKDAAAVLAPETPLPDRANMLFAGTVVTAGGGTGVVTATGMRTELGGIARLLGQAAPGPPPLQRGLDDLAQTLLAGALLAFAAVWAAGRLRGAPPAEIARAAAGIAVAAVPVGLPGIVASALALGARRMARRGAVVRAPQAVETLGSVAVILASQTDTLTLKQMTVRELHLEGERLEVTGSGYAPQGEILRQGRRAEPAGWETLAIALRIAALCPAARLRRGAGEGTWVVEGDPTEGALVVLAAKGGCWRDEAEAAHRVVAAFPRGADRRRTTVLVESPGGARPAAYTAGEPGDVLARCLHHRGPAGVRPLSPAERQGILRLREEMEERGLRVLGLAYREDVPPGESARIERAMVWVGLAGMHDPPRPGAEAAIAACRCAGIRAVIVTGDRKPAAAAVARQIGALGPGEEALSGEDLERMAPEALAASVERYRVFARVTAEQKLGIVRAWRRRGQLVAVNGEGASDAPSLLEADVGVSLGGRGAAAGGDLADVAVARAGLAGIVAAAEEGRAVADGIRRSAAYLLAAATGASLALLAAALGGLPPPLSPLQLLWAGLIAAGLPALALLVEPPGAGPMQAPQRAHGPLIGGGAAATLLLEGAAVAGATLAAFLLSRRGGAGSLPEARTHAFAVLGLALPLLALAAGTGSRPREGRGRLASLRLPGAVALAGLLLAALVQLPPLGAILDTVPLSRGGWAEVLLLGLAPLPAAALLRARGRGRAA